MTTKVYNVWTKNGKRDYALTINAKFERKLTCAFKNNMKNLANFQRLKNCDVILESKMATLNQNENSKQPNPPNAVWKFCLPWQLMNSTINKTFYRCSTQSLFLKYKKISKKAVKLGTFLQCSVHIFLGHDGYFWKINWRIVWNHLMKNFQEKHGKRDSLKAFINC